MNNKDTHTLISVIQVPAGPERPHRQLHVPVRWNFNVFPDHRRVEPSYSACLQLCAVRYNLRWQVGFLFLSLFF